MRHTSRLVAFALTLGAFLSALPGCVIGAVAGGMIESYRKTSTQEVAPKFDGLKGRSVAVLIAAEPGLGTDYPQLIGYLTTRITERLVDVQLDAGTTGFVPPSDVLAYTFNRPGWTAKTMSQVAHDLGGVDAIVHVDLYEFRIHDPGNMYLWNGLAAGTVSVYDMKSSTPDEAVFREGISVKFPDKNGQGPETFTATLVQSKLANRFIDRASWLFYTHQEPYYPEY